MNHSDFHIGLEFTSKLRTSQPYICSDIGTRVIVAIMDDEVWNSRPDRGPLRDGPSSDRLEFVFNERELEFCEPIEL